MNKQSFVFGEKLTLFAHRQFCNNAVKGLFSGFTYRSSALELNLIEEYAIYTDKAFLPLLRQGKEYHVTVTEDGFGIIAKDYKCLIRGFITLLEQITPGYEDEKYKFYIRCLDYEDNYSVQKRMIHLCVFPETDYSRFRRLIRLCAICQYTHICIEFWGMLQFDFCKALSWDNAYTKDRVKEIIVEMRQLGIEPIPMFNSFGHASLSRERSGKHVALDRYPEMHYLYTPDGWAYSIFEPKVTAFLENVRGELYELFEKPEYFHIGCDESYQRDKRYVEESHRYIGALCAAVLEEGVTPIMWADECLYSGQFPSDLQYICSAGDQTIAEKRLSYLPRETILADWQYNIVDKTVQSSAYLHSKGFRVIGCPWYREEALNAFLATEQTDGIMVTTWHTLGEYMPSILRFAEKMGAVMPEWKDSSVSPGTVAAEMLRKSGEGLALEYSSYGFMPKQL